jgi:hypothetical protein
MKTTVFILLMVLMSASILNAQNRNDIFDPNTNVTWLGIDFTSLKLIGDRERLGSESDIRHLLDAWNDLIIKEANKYTIANAIQRNTIANQIEVAKEHNAELDVLAMYSDDKKDYIHLSKEGVEEVISNYDFKGLSGIGLMFNAESFSKLNGEASIWITFIAMDTKKVLLTERMTASPGGGGMRNYWAGSIAKIIESMDKKAFETWRKKK